VVSTNYASRTSGQPTFLNIGLRYPNLERFQVVIWGRYRSAFPQPPETYYRDTTLCATGTVKIYQNVPEIEAQSPAQLEIQP